MENTHHQFQEDLKDRPRKRLGFCTPAERLAELMVQWPLESALSSETGGAPDTALLHAAAAFAPAPTPGPFAREAQPSPHLNIAATRLE